ncbi:MAG: polyribonucleotide nucleotidyltransferase [Deltaproteobacteria bacterium]|jgi:polyribonucleotide nucleotidyltransferase|nr:polyribonucleotide nucleotidyltransferase [Deltaproteobacteria bacterium]
MSVFNKNELRTKVELDFHGANISFESGWIAKQAGGAVVARQGDTMVIATVCSSPKEGEQDFFPLTVDYQEKSYANGKIPGGFLKREGRPAEHEILVCRLIDRPMRPLFPKGFNDEVQIIVTVLSADGTNSPDMLAICAVSAAVHVSDVPFLGPIAGVRVGRVNGQLIINPTPSQLEKSDINYVVAGTKEAIVMVEGGSQFVPEDEVLEALYFGHEEIKKLVAMQEELRAKVGKTKLEFAPKVIDPEFVAKVKGIVGDKLATALLIKGKHERRDAIAATKEELKTALGNDEYEEKHSWITTIYEEWISEIMRSRILDGIRIDGRKLTEVRPIDIETSIIPRAHGSALFTRGETQAIVTTTVGTADDSQRVDSLHTQYEKTFMLHYNFPPFSTGEIKKTGSAGRREIGHGNLAERALKPLIPTKNFPYVIRIVSDIMESNGSSSMASVCGGCLSLMDAGIQISEHVGGVAMGLVKEGERIAILTDILGDEDHFGDMDFKVCGSERGITALQMDIKCTGLSKATMQKALLQAREGRLHIISKMKEALVASRENLNQFAPVIYTMKVNIEKIRDIIGKGGVMIRSIMESTGTKVDVNDAGEVKIASSSAKAAERAMEIIKGVTEEPEIGKIYTGVVKRLVDFGAFVEILPNIEGLLHISQIADYRVNSINDELSEGDEVRVKVLDIDRQGKIRLSKKEAL